MSDNPQYPNQSSEFPEYWTTERKDRGTYSKTYLPGRFYSQRDMTLLHSINSELYNDIAEIIVQVYKIAPNQTTYNLYGEAKSDVGKVFYDAINLSTLPEPEDIEADETNKFGPDRSQNMVFKFRERDCIKTNFFPEIGDIVLYNERYYEIDNNVQDQFLGGHPDKSWSIIVHTHYTRLSKINLVERQS